ncbi:MAG: hypothetical protein A2908_02240 [Candidatus Staskawiczbacteria bacterium RIFCSPLOWO2_01_FULL_38_12b]|uniref:Uncharacterized protein n=1 Tax=Candidatus Staskawiczbacteria bacterium RIFCSPLOWO2_01_FULL_38_12b TaxID=1802214 RepID=A0A1G2IE30_9BACT|nr:MAG: hypothetical protein A2908_02240 [Candidatus Staskawiczbacteria bacterium RIFCSPLOWO2_01_FULL_38_12b]
MKEMLSVQITMTAFIFILFFIATISFGIIGNWWFSLISAVASGISWKILTDKCKEYEEKFGNQDSK